MTLRRPDEHTAAQRALSSTINRQLAINASVARVQELNGSTHEQILSVWWDDVHRRVRRR